MNEVSSTLQRLSTFLAELSGSSPLRVEQWKIVMKHAFEAASVPYAANRANNKPQRKFGR